MKGAREGCPGSGLDLPRPEGGTEERRWTGWWPPAPETGHLGLLGYGALQDWVLCARGGAFARAGTCLAGALLVPRPHPRGFLLCVSRRGHAPFSQERPTHLFPAGDAPFPLSRPYGEFCRTGVRCEVAGLGDGEGECGGNRGQKSLPEGIRGLGPLEPEC